jgi:hypothetical protein
MTAKLRLLLLFTVMLALLAAVPFTLAQEETFGLSAEDFALFTSQNADSDALGFDFAVDLSVTGAPEGNVVVDLSGSGAFGMDAAGMPVGTLDLSGSADVGAGSQPFSLQVIMVDGIVYFNLGDGSGWMGQSLDSAMSGLEDMMALPVDPAALASGDMSALEDNPQAMQALGEVMNALSTFDPATLISIARLADMNSQAHFQVNIDIMSFFASDAFNQMMTAVGEASGDESVAGMGMLIGMLLQDVRLTFDQFIGLEDSRVRQGVLDFGLTVDPSALGEEGGPITVDFKLDVSNIDYNPSISVSAPADAFMLDNMGG